MQKYFKQGFTLVELIVVITILAILATIGFMSYQGYALSARESTRLSDLGVIEKQLSLYQVRNSMFPLPNDYVTITASGTTIGYQGAAGTGVLKTIGQADRVVDPLDGEFYSYFVDTSRVSMQTLAMMENEESIIAGIFPQIYAAPDYSERYPLVSGKPLGIMTTSDNIPIHQTGVLATLDIVNYSGSNNYTAHFTNSRSVTGTGAALWKVSQDANCSRIRELVDINSGTYTINPKQKGEMEVYCEMDIDGGGWTMIARTVVGGTGDFGWLVSTGSLSDNTSPYSLGSGSINMGFDEIMFASYTTDMTIDKALKVSVDPNYVKNSANHSYKRRSTSCQELYPTTTSWRSACDGDGEDGKSGGRNFASTWGWLADTNGDPFVIKYVFRNGGGVDFSTNQGTQLAPSTNPWGGITANGYTQGDCANDSTCSSFGEFGDEQAMIFVR